MIGFLFAFWLLMLLTAAIMFFLVNSIHVDITQSRDVEKPEMTTAYIGMWDES